MKVEELRQLSKAATPGPWRVYEAWTGSMVADCVERDGPTVHLILDRTDNTLIAAMRNHLDALLDVAEAAKAFRDELWRKSQNLRGFGLGGSVDPDELVVEDLNLEGAMERLEAQP